MFKRFKKIVGSILKLMLVIVIIGLLGFGKWTSFYNGLENFLLGIDNSLLSTPFSFHFFNLDSLKEALIDFSKNNIAFNIIGIILLTFLWLFLQIYTELLSKDKTDRHIIWVYLTSVFILTALIVISANIYGEWQINKLLFLVNGKSNPADLSEAMKYFSTFIDMITKGLSWSDIVFIIIYIFGIISAVFSSSTINALSSILPGGTQKREKTEENIDKNFLQLNDSSLGNDTEKKLVTKKITKTDGEDKKNSLKKISSMNPKPDGDKTDKIIPKKISFKKNTNVNNLK